MAFTAGGNANDLRSPYPNNEYCIEFGPFDVKGNQDTSVTVQSKLVPFACKPVRCDWSAEFVEITSGALTVNIEDDTATAKSIVTDQTLVATASGAAIAAALTLKKSETIYAGAQLKCSYVAENVSNTAKGVSIRLWVEPVH